MTPQGPSAQLRSRSGALLAILGLQTAAGLPVGFWHFFSTFQPHDDESTFLLWDRHLLQGSALYDEVWSFYGPFPFLLRWLLHGMVGAPLTHEVTRLWSLGLWLGTALLVALAVYRITGRLLPTALAHPLILLGLRPLANEPGHPQGVVALLIAAAALLAGAFDPRAPARAAAGFGALLAALLLTKVNAGTYLAVALALGFALAARGERLARRLRLLAGAAALALPLAAMGQRALRGPWSGFALGIWIPVGCLSALWLRPPRPGLFGLRTAAAALASLAAASVLLVAIAMEVFGSSLAGLLRSVFVLPARVPGHLEFVWGPARRPDWLSLAGSLALFGLLRLAKARRSAAVRKPMALALAAVQVLYGLGGCAAVLAVGTRAGVAAIPGPALPFLWLILLPAPGSDSRSEGAVARLLLGLLAATQVLYLYPISGSQAEIASLLMIPCALVCLDDGLRGIWLALRPAPRSRLLSRAAVALAALSLAAAWLGFGARARAVYAAQVPLRLPGAERLRLPEPSVALYRWLSANLERHCDTYFASPGLGAPYFWADLPAPGPLQASFWFWVFDAAQQQSIRDELERFPRACALLDSRATAFSLSLRRGGRPPLPLLVHLEQEFETVGAVSTPGATGSWEFRVRRGRRLGGDELTLAAIPVSTGPRGRSPWRELRVELPAFPGERATRLSVVDPVRGIELADSREGSSTPRLRVRTQQGRVLAGAGPLALDLSREQTLRLRWRVEPEHGGKARFRVVRIYGASGELLAPVPVLSALRRAEPVAPPAGGPPPRSPGARR